MRTAAALSLLLAVATTPASAEPIQRHPKNGRYLVFKGKPAILVGGGEHYGAVLNLDFDYTRYLDTMQKDGLNLTRLFVGTYYEKPGDFGIGNNTLAPAPGRALTPWQRSDTPGAADGGNKFDLEKWNDAYFARLEDFVAQASARGIAVEVVMFSAYYRGGWAGSPMNAANNVNGVGALTKEQANTLDNGSLKAAQERVVRKIVRELKDADNVYYEIQNEPWADLGQPAGILNAGILPQDMQGGAAGFWKNRVDLANAASLAWQKHIAQIIADEEQDLPKDGRHLIAQNYCNFKHPLKDVDPNVGILNFHYAWPEAATLNLGHDKVIAFDETGFATPNDKTQEPETDAVYRRQAWEFLMSGGGVFSMLDYSFAVGNEDGTFVNKAPGGGSPALRRQLKLLKDFLHSFDIPSLRPQQDTLKSALGAYARVLGTDKAIGVYVAGDGQTDVTLELKPGKWRAEWIDTLTGERKSGELFIHKGGPKTLKSPAYVGDIALRVVQ